MLNDDVKSSTECSEIRSRLGRWFDGESDPAAAARVEDHLRGCRRCRAQVDGWERVGRLLEIGLPAPEPGETVAALVRHRMAVAWWIRVAAAAIITASLGALGGHLTADRVPEAGRDPARAMTLLDEAFSPGSLRGMDALARDLAPPATGGS